MLTVATMMEIVDGLYSRQADRLIKSSEDIETFLARPEEAAVSFEIDCYENLIKHPEAAQA